MRRYGLRDVDVLKHLRMQQAAFNGMKNGKRGEPTLGTAKAVCRALSACTGKEVLIDEVFGPNCGILDYRVERINGVTKEVRVMNELSREQYQRDTADLLIARLADKRRALADMKLSLQEDIDSLGSLATDLRIGDIIEFTIGGRVSMGTVTGFALYPDEIPPAHVLRDRIAVWVTVKKRGVKMVGAKKLVMPWWNPRRATPRA